MGEIDRRVGVTHVLRGQRGGSDRPVDGAAASDKQDRQPSIEPLDARAEWSMGIIMLATMQLKGATEGRHIFVDSITVTRTRPTTLRSS